MTQDYSYDDDRQDREEAAQELYLDQAEYGYDDDAAAWAEEQDEYDPATITFLMGMHPSVRWSMSYWQQLADAYNETQTFRDAVEALAAVLNEPDDYDQ